MTRALEVILGVCLILLLLSAVLYGINQFRSGEYTEDHNVTTGVGVTTASVVLSQALFDSETYYTTITSNVTLDAPVPSSYTTATRTLTVGGLQQSMNHRLTVVYRYNQLGSYWAVDLAARAWPLFLAIGLISIIGAAGYAAWHSARGGD